MKKAGSLIVGSCGTNSRCEDEESRDYTPMQSVSIAGSKHAVPIVPWEYYLNGYLYVWSDVDQLYLVWCALNMLSTD